MDENGISPEKLKGSKKKFRDYSRGRKIFNIFGVIILLLLFIEIFLRFLGFVFLLKFDNLKDTDISAGSDLTIMCVGDSWTIGNWRDNYPKFLKKKLKRLYPEKKINVINLGVAGSNSTMALKKIKKEFPVYNPNIVIVMTGNNDHWNLEESTYWLFESRKLTGWDIFFAKIKVSLHSLRTYKFFRMIYRKIAGVPTTNEFFYKNPDDDRKRKNIVSIDRKIFKKQLEFNLVKIVEYCKNRGSRLIFMTYFHFHGFHVNEYIRDIAIRFGIPLVDNNFLFHKMIDPALYRDYLISDGHPNGKGYDFIADRIIDILKNRKIMEGK